MKNQKQESYQEFCKVYRPKEPPKTINDGQNLS